MYPYRELFDRIFNERLSENAKETVIEFFVVFSRFEYALKRAGYVSGNEKRASANWDKFASDIEDAFRPDQTAELQNAVTYLQNSPPRKQVVQDDELRWKDNTPSKNEPRLRWLLRLVRTVRNNLFHGEKFRTLLEEHPPRDIDLMTPLKKLQVGGFNRDSVPLLSIERPNLGMMPSNTMHFRSFSPTDWMGMTFFQ